MAGGSRRPRMSISQELIKRTLMLSMPFILPIYQSFRGRPANLLFSKELLARFIQLDGCGWGCEVPVGLGVVGIAVLLPSGDFVDQGLFVGDAAIEALGRQDTQ